MSFGIRTEPGDRQGTDWNAATRVCKGFYKLSNVHYHDNVVSLAKDNIFAVERLIKMEERGGAKHFLVTQF